MHSRPSSPPLPRSQVSDVETDVSELTIEITALPAAGALYENGVQITSPPRTLSATVLQLRIDSIDGLATDDIGSHHYSVVHIGLRVTDPHGGQLVASMPVRIIDSLNRCSPGHILRSMPEGSLCEACEAGKYERDNIFCEQADSLHFVPVGGQTADGLVPCPAHTRHSAIVVEEEGVSVNVQTGASSSAQCSCQQGYYLPSQPAIRANWTGQAGRLVLELTELSSSELVEVLQHAGCVACPKGAVCLGNWLPPIAEAGYAALLEDSFEAFYACTPASSCLPGRHLTARTWLPMQCDAGYQDGSPLCSLCEGSNGYGKTRGECLKCDWPDFVYMIATFGIVIVWFPLMAKLVEMMESLEISFAYLQFLGLYSSFSITWPEPMASLFSGLAFFTLDIDLMHFSCVLPEDDGFHFFVVWAFQAFLPLLFIVLCLVHLAASWIMYRMALAGGLRDLIARGWRPRRQFTFSSVRDTYLPQAVMCAAPITGALAQPSPRLPSPLPMRRFHLRPSQCAAFTFAPPNAPLSPSPLPTLTRSGPALERHSQVHASLLPDRRREGLRPSHVRRAARWVRHTDGKVLPREESGDAML